MANGRLLETSTDRFRSTQMTVSKRINGAFKPVMPFAAQTDPQPLSRFWGNHPNDNTDALSIY